jgi:hypothetical protein
MQGREKIAGRIENKCSGIGKMMRSLATQFVQHYARMTSPSLCRQLNRGIKVKVVGQTNIEI